MEHHVRVNVSGSVFYVETDIFNQISESLVKTSSSLSKFYCQVDGTYFISRDPQVFSCVINLFRYGELHVPKQVCGVIVRRELEFWGLSDVKVSKCCLQSFYDTMDNAEIFKQLEENQTKGHPCGDEETMSLSTKAWLFLESPSSSSCAKMWNCLHIAIILLSTLTVLLWNEWRVEPYLIRKRFPKIENGTFAQPKLQNLFLKDPAMPLLISDMICISFFTIESVLRFCVCPRKRSFLKSPLNTLSVILITPMWVSFFLEIRKDLLSGSAGMGIIFLSCKFVNILRVLYLFRVSRCYAALNVLLMSVKNSGKEILLLFVIFGIASLIFGCSIYAAEFFEPKAFPNIVVAVWWAVITLTTVGYGDVYPVSTVGRIVGCFAAGMGVLLLALPVAVIASNFSTLYRIEKNRARCGQVCKDRRNADIYAISAFSKSKKIRSKE